MNVYEKLKLAITQHDEATALLLVAEVEADTTRLKTKTEQLEMLLLAYESDEGDWDSTDLEAAAPVAETTEPKS